MKKGIKGILNRLEIIKNLIAIGEVEEIEEQNKKLRVFSDLEGINEIITDLKKKKYQEALILIDKFIKQSNQIVSVDETEIYALKTEINLLEQNLAELEEEKAAIESKVNEFQIAYQKHLGALTEEFLRLRKERLEKESAKDSNKTNEYKQANKDYYEYQRLNESITEHEKTELSPEEQDQLRKAFRKACKLCHPDVVPEEDKQKGQDIFIELREAYGKNDLNRVLDILNHLENDSPLDHKKSKSTKQQIIEERSRLRIKIANLEKEIQKLKESDIYQLLNNVSNWEGYFADKKYELNRQIESLRIISNE